MKAEDIVGKLLNMDYEFQYKGTMSSDIYAVGYLPAECRAEEMTDNTIYICKMTDILKQKLPADTGIIIVEKGTELGLFFKAVFNVVNEDTKRRAGLLELTENIRRGVDICELAEKCSVILSSRIGIFSRSFNLICQYPKETFLGQKAEEFKNILERRINRADISEEGTDCKIRQIFYRRETYLLAAWKDEFDEVDIKYMDRLCGAFCDRATDRISTKENEIRRTLLSLLRKNTEDPEREKMKLKRLGLKCFEKIYLLVIETNECRGEIDTKEIKNIINPDEIFLTENYIVAFHHSEKYEEYTEKNFKELCEYAAKNNLVGALSIGFSDLAYCSVMYEHCKICIDIIKERCLTGFWYLGRYQMSVLLRILNKNQTVDIKSFCNSVILSLYEIDKQQNTNWVDTLFVYLCSNQSVKKSAEAMNIHVNTMYMRINRLKDEFKIDFNDVHLLYQLHNSINFLSIYDYSILKEGYPFLKN